MILTMKRNSEKMLLLCLIVMTAKNFIMLAASFNKLILGLNFIYLIFAFYFFVVWELEVEKASFNPLFSKRDLEKESRFHLKGQIESVTDGSLVDVSVTNIDENGCFVLFSDTYKLPLKFNTSATYYLKTKYEGVEFFHEARAISSYDRGLGLEFIQLNNTKKQPDWSDLCKVCLERGLFN